MSRATASVTCSLAIVLPCTACEEGQVANIALDQPLQIRGQFIPGDLPGVQVATDAQVAEVDTSGDGGMPQDRLSVISSAVPQVPIPAGAGGVPLVSLGLVSTDSAAVGVRFSDMGTGYWVVPVGPVDIMTGDLTFGMVASFNASDPPGRHDLVFVAIDGAGNAGTQRRESICLDSVTPDNAHACFPDNWPPTAVFSLAWDVDFDLDLHVITPDGTDINAKTHASNDFPGYGDAGILVPATAARIDRDSLDHCIPDGYRREDVYWPQPAPPSDTNPLNSPAKGRYLVYANAFAPCGQSAVRFSFTLYRLIGQCPDCQVVPQAPVTGNTTVSGEVLGGQLTGGGMSRTFVAEYSL